MSDTGLGFCVVQLLLTLGLLTGWLAPTNRPIGCMENSEAISGSVKRDEYHASPCISIHGIQLIWQQVIKRWRTDKSAAGLRWHVR